LGSLTADENKNPEGASTQALGWKTEFMNRLKNLIRRNPAVHRGVKTMLAWFLNLRCARAGKPPAYIPRHLQGKFSMAGRVPILYGYADGSKSTPLEYSGDLIKATCGRIAARELGHYRKVDQWLYDALTAHPVNGQQVAIMGSADQGYGPWYECICLEFGGKPTTIDYNPIQFGNSRDFHQRGFLEIGRAGNGRNQIGDKIGPALIDVLHLRPLAVHALRQFDKAVIAPARHGDQD